MNQSRQCEWKSQPGNFRSNSFFNNFDSKNRIQYQFSLINENIQAKGSKQSSNPSQLFEKKIEISKLQAKMEETQNRMNKERDIAKTKLKNVSNKVKQIATFLNERQLKTAEKIANLKKNIEKSLKSHQYLTQITLNDIEEQYSKVIINIASNKQKNSHNQFVNGQKNIVQNIKKQIKELNKEFLTFKNTNEKKTDSILVEFDEKIHQWRNKISLAEQDHLMLINRLKSHVEEAKEQIERQLIEERKARQQNKQKLLTLFQNNCQPLPKLKNI